jgi:hypothetical protein
MSLGRRFAFTSSLISSFGMPKTAAPATAGCVKHSAQDGLRWTDRMPSIPKSLDQIVETRPAERLQNHDLVIAARSQQRSSVS